MKKGQIGVEIMYAVGVLLVIFIILSAIAFDRRIDIRDARDTIMKKNDCYMIANKLNSVAALGEGYTSEFKTNYFADIFDTGVIYLGDNETDEQEIELVCTFNGKLNQSNYINLTGRWKVFNNGEDLELIKN